MINLGVGVFSRKLEYFSITPWWDSSAVKERENESNYPYLLKISL